MTDKTQSQKEHTLLSERQHAHQFKYFWLWPCIFSKKM